MRCWWFENLLDTVNKSYKNKFEMNWQPGWQGGSSGVTRIPAAVLGAWLLPVSRIGNLLPRQGTNPACPSSLAVLAASVWCCARTECVSLTFIAGQKVRFLAIHVYLRMVFLTCCVLCLFLWQSLVLFPEGSRPAEAPGHVEGAPRPEDAEKTQNPDG